MFRWRPVIFSFALTLCASCSDRALEGATAYSRGFSVEPVDSGPELQIWTEEYVGGSVVGYIARPGVLSIYEAHPGLGFRTGDLTGPVSHRVIATAVADDLIAMIPNLRHVSFEGCTPMVDGGGVIVTGWDAAGRFAFEMQNHDTCEGGNIDALNRALDVAASQRE